MLQTNNTYKSSTRKPFSLLRRTPQSSLPPRNGGNPAARSGTCLPPHTLPSPRPLVLGLPPPPPSGTSTAGVGSRGSPTAGDRRAAAGSRELRGSESPFGSTPACRPGTSPSLRSQGLDHGTAADPRCPQRGSARGGCTRCPRGHHPARGAVIDIELAKAAIETKGEWREMKKWISAI